MLPRAPLPRAALALLLAGCSGHASSTESNAACTAIAPPPATRLPTVSATGATATAITQALAAIFAAQAPPLSPGPTYAIPTLECSDVGSGPPGGSSGGYQCEFQVQVAGGQPIPITLSQPSTLAQNLLTAVTASGAMSCPGKESSGGISVANVHVSAGSVQYEDTSSYAAFPTPNVVVRGADATSVIDAFSGAGIDDCDPTRYVFLICSTENGAPSCGYQWMPMAKVGSSEAVPICTIGVPAQGGPLTAAWSLALWQSVLTAAQDGGFQPTSGTLAQTTVVNARYFTWDGTSLTFTLVQGDATPPP